MTNTRIYPRKRSTYRHGDLHRALLEAGTELARAGGPAAVVLREATRRVGVAPNAAYRHFADRQALLEAVCSAALSQLAVAIEEELARLPRARDPVPRARARLRAVGAGYLRFAEEEPGLFRTAFSVPADLAGIDQPDRAGRSGMTAFRLLATALDGLVEARLLPRERRPGAEFLAWSAVHGLAMLLLDGPLRGTARSEVAAIEQRVIEMVERGL